MFGILLKVETNKQKHWWSDKRKIPPQTNQNQSNEKKSKPNETDSALFDCNLGKPLRVNWLQSFTSTWSPSTSATFRPIPKRKTIFQSSRIRKQSLKMRTQSAVVNISRWMIRFAPVKVCFRRVVESLLGGGRKGKGKSRYPWKMKSCYRGAPESSSLERSEVVESWKVGRNRYP